METQEGCGSPKIMAEETDTGLRPPWLTPGYESAASFLCLLIQGFASPGGFLLLLASAVGWNHTPLTVLRTRSGAH